MITRNKLRAAQIAYPGHIEFFVNLGESASQPDRLKLIEVVLVFAQDGVELSTSPKHTEMFFLRVLGDVRPAVPQESADYETLRRNVLTLLNLLEATADRPLSSPLRENVETFVNNHLTVNPVMNADNRALVLQVDVDISTVEAACYFAIALLAASPTLRARLRRCALPECGRIFLDDVTRGGKARLFCCEEHSATDRMRKFRARQAQAKSARTRRKPK